MRKGLRIRLLLVKRLWLYRRRLVTLWRLLIRLGEVVSNFGKLGIMKERLVVIGKFLQVNLLSDCLFILIVFFVNGF